MKILNEIVQNLNWNEIQTIQCVWIELKNLVFNLVLIQLN